MNWGVKVREKWKIFLCNLWKWKLIIKAKRRLAYWKGHKDLNESVIYKERYSMSMFSLQDYCGTFT